MPNHPPEDVSLRTPPHAVGPEKYVLSCLMKDPAACFPLARLRGISEASFHLPHHVMLFMEMERVHSQGGGIELVSFTQHLLDHGRLDAIGGPASLTDIYTYAPSEAHFTRNAEVLKDKETRRGLLRLFADGIEAVHEDPDPVNDHLARATQRMRELSSAAGAATGSLREMAYLIRYDSATIPPADEVCLLLGDIPVAARGNVSVLQGKSKVGKSAVVSAILGATMAKGSARPGDCLGFRWLDTPDAAPGAVMHLDTEQSPSDWHGLVSRSLRRAGLTSAPERLVSLPVIGFARSQRLALLRQALEHEREHGSGTDIIIIDGIADLCGSPNDEAEGLELVSQLMALSQDFGTAILCIIHENPSTDVAKTRGHLGSELNRKAFANLRIDKDTATGVSVIYGTDMRKRDLPLAHGFCFQWDDAAKMHVSRGRNAAMRAETRDLEAREKARDYWEPFFEAKGKTGGIPFLTIREAIEIEREIKGNEEPTSETTMKKRLQRAEVLGVLRKTDRGIYALIPKGKTGNQSET